MTNKFEISESILITNLAKSKILEILKKNVNKKLLLTLKKSGCNGFSYDWILKEDIDKDFYFVEIEDEKGLYFKREELIYFVNSEIDYIKKGLNEEFEIINPNTKGSCGCGESVNF